MKNTYNSDTSSLLRFIGGKIDKDYIRYRVLLDLIKYKSSIITYSKDKFKMNKIEFDDKSYTYEYIPDIVDPDNISLPVLIEKKIYRENTKLRLELDKMKIYSALDFKLYSLFKAYYIITRAKPVRRKIMYSFDINNVESIVYAYLEKQKQGHRHGGNKLDAIITSIDEDDDIEILNKSLCKLSFQDDISNDIVNDIGVKKIEIENKLLISEPDEKINNIDIDNYVISIMTSDYSSSKEKMPAIIKNFYKNLDKKFL